MKTDLNKIVDTDILLSLRNALVVEFSRCFDDYRSEGFVTRRKGSRPKIIEDIYLLGLSLFGGKAHTNIKLLLSEKSKLGLDRNGCPTDDEVLLSHDGSVEVTDVSDPQADHHWDVRLMLENLTKKVDTVIGTTTEIKIGQDVVLKRLERLESQVSELEYRMDTLVRKK